MSKNAHVLIHGQIYTMSEDELMHWKYIKREKQPDGSYKYYYDTSEEDKAWKASKKAEYDATQAGNRMGKAQIDAEKAYQEYEKNRIWGATSDRSLIEKRDEAYKKLQDAEKEVDAATAAYKVAKKKAEKTVNKYKTQKVANFLNKTISKGITTVTQLITSIFTGNKNAVIEKREGKKIIYNNDFSDISDKKVRKGR